MPTNARKAIAGSERTALPNATVTGPVDANDFIEVTVVLRRRHADLLPDHDSPSHPRFRTRAEFGTIYGAAPEDVAQVEEFAHEHGLVIAQHHEGSRSILLSGTATAMEAAFGTKLSYYGVPEVGIQYRGRTGELTLPETLHSVVIAVLGLDNRPVAKPHFRVKPKAAVTGAFSPAQLAQLYGFPTGATASGQTVAIIELGGGYKAADLTTYFKGLNLPVPKVTAVSVDKGTNKPGSDADGEVMLDIEVVGAVAPGANIVVYFAPNTDKGFLDAISQAAHDATRNPSVISISWGGPEDNWTAQARNAMNAALQDAAAMNVTVTVAAGDDGATDGVSGTAFHVDFPASSPYALSCGGTSVKASGAAISSEQVWNDLATKNGATGGGVSRVFALPSYQANAGVPLHPQTKFKGRGVPDVAGDADPQTGYMVRVDGQDQVIGGTSAVAPLWAGLIALCNHQLGHAAGYLHPLLYQTGESIFRDITTGNNGGYNAAKNWDACTGLGSPNGTALLHTLLGTKTKT